MSVTQFPARITLGGSDAAAAAGVDPYCSPVQLWLYLTGRDQRVETEAMRWGKLLEPLIVTRLRDDGYPLTYPIIGDGFTDPDRPWLLGHPDGLAVSGHSLGQRPDAVLEVKTANAWAHAAANGDVPLHYAAQCQIYMHLTRLDKALLAVLVAGQRLEVREIDRDDRAIGLLLDRMERFLGFVQRDEPPAPPTAADREALGKLWPEHTPGRVVRLLGDEWQALKDLRGLIYQEKVIKAQRAEKENIVKLAMGDAETAISPHDDEVAHWRTVTSRRLDYAALREQRKHIYDLFVTETQTRRFTVT